eukprot:CAMPEP_0117040980 /NCGR_PEP_ID=MMETSP0472-20121206/28645_1 /TAXON_ID=693140 ORGANISM="Tiarina fusus, Strain LIS" /NCGR_SAMPLE_ID=MMETSP0472 /ASSEMBLY_ACC=CAM_ASM_000603 /LENGTH=180 /DNA_ID=CAMNT_0004751861 /DNA_START=154 /DNA_END=696 /DNA_ORIENTATION=-
MTFARLSATLMLLFGAGLTQGFVPAARPVAKVVGGSMPMMKSTTSSSSSTRAPLYTPLSMATDPETSKTSNLPFWLDVGTKGGAIVVSLILFIVPIIIYSIVTSVFGFDEIEAGKWIGVGFTAIATFLWVGTYIFRVATKDMTYAKQLKDYENAVIAKRLEELDDDEIQALVEEIDRDDF